MVKTAKAATLIVWDEGQISHARLQLLKTALSNDDYTIRLWEAEAKLESIGYARGRDGRWRKRITAAEFLEMTKLREIANLSNE